MSLRLSFHGAAQTVTGSCFRLEAGGRTVLFDCGLFQGSKTLRELNYQAFPFQPWAVDAVVLTHAHIDHAGLLPKLVKHGFKGLIHATPATVDLCSVMLPDSGNIQETEVDRLNRRNRQRGQDEVEPIYTMADAVASMEHFAPVSYGRWFEPVPGIRVRFWNAGHMLGSASAEVEARDGDGPAVSIFFSGDIGPDNKLLQHDPEAPAGCDYLICESTFGAVDRRDYTVEARRAALAEEVRRAASRGGALLIPSFAVERTQEVVTDLMLLMSTGAIPAAPVFIDSPLARRATEIFVDHAGELDNAAALRAALASPHLRISETVDDSKAIGRLKGFHIVLSASGMAEAGRIRHHLKNHLWRRDATVLMVGYQAEATLGRLLLDGARKVRIHNEDIAVEAAIAQISTYSGHADGPELARWIEERLPVRRGLFLVHGEEPGMTGLARRVAAEAIPHQAIHRPEIDACYDLSGPRAMPVKGVRRRVIEPPEAVHGTDWHNDLTRLMLDINDRIGEAADARARGVIIRRLRRALDGEPPPRG